MRKFQESAAQPRALCLTIGFVYFKIVKRVDLTVSVLNTHTHKGVEGKLEVINICISLIVVMVKWVYTYIQTYQVVLINYMQLLKNKLHCDEPGEKEPKWALQPLLPPSQDADTCCSSNKLLLGDFLSRAAKANNNCWSGKYGICRQLHVVLSNTRVGFSNIRIPPPLLSRPKRQTGVPLHLSTTPSSTPSSGVIAGQELLCYTLSWKMLAFAYSSTGSQVNNPGMALWSQGCVVVESKATGLSCESEPESQYFRLHWAESSGVFEWERKTRGLQKCLMEGRLPLRECSGTRLALSLHSLGAPSAL